MPTKYLLLITTTKYLPVSRVEISCHMTGGVNCRHANLEHLEDAQALSPPPRKGKEISASAALSRDSGAISTTARSPLSSSRRICRANTRGGALWAWG